MRLAYFFQEESKDFFPLSAGIFAYFARNWWLMVFAVVAGLSPLLLIWIILLVMKIVYVVTGGRYPGPEWL